MKHSKGHTRKRGGIYCGNSPRRIVKKKGGLMDLVVAAKINTEIPTGVIRSKSITKQFRSRQRKK